MKDYQLKDDADLIYLISMQDEKALAQIIDRYHNMLMKIACFYLKDEHHAEEILADYFYNIWEKGNNLKIKGSVKNYFAISIKNNCLSLIQKNQIKERTFSDYDYDIQDRKCADDLIIMDELNNSLKDFIQSLPERRSLIFSLSRFEGLSFEEIADLLGIAPKTVANQIALALQDITEQFKV